MKTTALVLVAALSLPAIAFAHGDGTGVPGADFLKEWDIYGTGAVTLDDIQTRRAEIFEMFDLNGDGMIDAEEGANMAQTVAGQQENNRAQKGEGQMQGQAMGQGQGKGMGQGHGQGMGQGKGQGQGKGMGQANAMGQGQNGGPGQVIHAAMEMQANDSNGDGMVTRDEFLSQSAPIFAALDRTGDGQVNLDDFAR